VKRRSTFNAMMGALHVIPSVVEESPYLNHCNNSSNNNSGSLVGASSQPLPRTSHELPSTLTQEHGSLPNPAYGTSSQAVAIVPYTANGVTSNLGHNTLHGQDSSHVGSPGTPPAAPHRDLVNSSTGHARPFPLGNMLSTGSGHSSWWRSVLTPSFRKSSGAGSVSTPRLAGPARTSEPTNGSANGATNNMGSVFTMSSQSSLIPHAGAGGSNSGTPRSAPYSRHTTGMAGTPAVSPFAAALVEHESQYSLGTDTSNTVVEGGVQGHPGGRHTSSMPQQPSMHLRRTSLGQLASHKSQPLNASSAAQLTSPDDSASQPSLSPHLSYQPTNGSSYPQQAQLTDPTVSFSEQCPMSAQACVGEHGYTENGIPLPPTVVPYIVHQGQNSGWAALPAQERVTANPTLGPSYHTLDGPSTTTDSLAYTATMTEGRLDMVGISAAVHLDSIANTPPLGSIESPRQRQQHFMPHVSLASNAVVRLHGGDRKRDHASGTSSSEQGPTQCSTAIPASG
jgi:hypothetical protein